MIGKIICSMLGFVLFFSCSKPSNVNVEKKQNVLAYQDKFGIVSRIEVEKYRYSLNDKIRLSLLTVNHSDSHKVHIHTNNGPLWRFDIYDENNELVESLPHWRTNTIYNFYFSPGDSFKSNLNWNQSLHSNGHFSGLKIFSGDYYITGSQPGLPANKVGVWINISDEGEPLSTKLFWYFSDPDSIKLDFLVRNRTSEELDYQLKENAKIKLQFFNAIADSLVGEIDLKQKITNLHFSAKSDSKILSYKESKAVLKAMGLIGSFNCKIMIPCKNRNLIANGTVVIN